MIRAIIAYGRRSMLQYDGRTVLIDTTPDFRQQALREGIRASTRFCIRTRMPTTSWGSMTCAL